MSSLVACSEPKAGRGSEGRASAGLRSSAHRASDAAWSSSPLRTTSSEQEQVADAHQSSPPVPHPMQLSSLLLAGAALAAAGTPPLAQAASVTPRQRALPPTGQLLVCRTRQADQNLVRPTLLLQRLQHHLLLRAVDSRASPRPAPETASVGEGSVEAASFTSRAGRVAFPDPSPSVADARFFASHPYPLGTTRTDPSSKPQAG